MAAVKEYAKKLREINKLYAYPEMAKRMGVNMRTIPNWFQNAEGIKLKYAERIDKLHAKCENKDVAS